MPPKIITASYVSAGLGGDPSEKLCSSTVLPSSLAVVENDPEGTSLSWIRERMRITESVQSIRTGYNIKPNLQAR